MKLRELVLEVGESTKLIEAVQKLELGEQDSMSNLPSEILMDILLRLPLVYIVRCKCVCKELVDLVTSPEFVRSHLSRAVPGLVVFEFERLTSPYKIVGCIENAECRSGVVIKFNLPCHELNSLPVHSSADGLLFLYRRGFGATQPILSICNPITRDYIKLPYAKPAAQLMMHVCETYGFGVSRISGQYKVVRMFTEGEVIEKFECQVYTLGTGSWRRIASGRSLKYDKYSWGVFLKGNLHWFATDAKSATELISCFDLETELFTTFSAPPFDPPMLRNLSVLGDCLCLTYNRPLAYIARDEVHIWLMKEYGDDKSWTKEFIIRTDFRDLLYPIKILEDGDILIGWYWHDKMSAAIYIPTFVSLKTFVMENVISF